MDVLVHVNVSLLVLFVIDTVGLTVSILIVMLACFVQPFLPVPVTVYKDGMVNDCDAFVVNELSQA